MSKSQLREIKNFLPSTAPGKDPIALRSIILNNGKTLVITFVVENTFGVAYLHSKIREANVTLLADLCPRSNYILTQ